MSMNLDLLDRQIINHLQTGFPVCDEPYAQAAAALGTDEAALLVRLQHLLENQVLTRFGPLYRADRLGGAFSLVAMKVPDEEFEKIADIVNSFAEVAHNYQREHGLNLWFVVTASNSDEVDATIKRIEQATGLEVLDLPLEKAYHIDLGFSVWAHSTA